MQDGDNGEHLGRRQPVEIDRLAQIVARGSASAADTFRHVNPFDVRLVVGDDPANAHGRVPGAID